MMNGSTWRRTALTAATLAVLALTTMSAKGGAPAAKTYNVSSMVFDTDAFANPTLVQGDDPTDASATYAAGSEGVISQIDTGNTDWNLDLRSSNRAFLLTAITTSGAPVPGLPAGPILYSGRIVSRCYAPTGGTTAYSWFNVTDDRNCAMRVNFTSGGSTYTMVMSPGYAGTGTASVHCNAFGESSCVDWTVTPNPNAANAGVANLYVITKSGSERFVAACRLTFRMHVTQSLI